MLAPFARVIPRRTLRTTAAAVALRNLQIYDDENLVANAAARGA